MKPVYRIGLTGGIGSGKTTVSDMFRELGVPVIDADVIAREIVEPGLPAYNQVVDLFGKKIVDDGGALRRDLIRELVFSDAVLKHRLEAIIHPGVREEVERRVSACNYPYCIISIPLLLETGADYSVDRILVVDAGEELQLDRVQKRDGVSRDQALAIMNSQVGRQARLEAADDVVDNTDGPEATKNQVAELHRKYIDMTSQSDNVDGTGNS